MSRSSPTRSWERGSQWSRQRVNDEGIAGSPISVEDLTDETYTDADIFKIREKRARSIGDGREERRYKIQRSADKHDTIWVSKDQIRHCHNALADLKRRREERKMRRSLHRLHQPRLERGGKARSENDVDLSPDLILVTESKSRKQNSLSTQEDLVDLDQEQFNRSPSAKLLGPSSRVVPRFTTSESIPVVNQLDKPASSEKRAENIRWARYYDNPWQEISDIRGSPTSSYLYKRTKRRLTQPPYVPEPSVETHTQDRHARRKFRKLLSKLSGPPVSLVNTIDTSTPSLEFEFVDRPIPSVGVRSSGLHPISDEFLSGCDCSSGGSRRPGCESAGSCDCMANMERPIFFPYESGGDLDGVLSEDWLDTRNAIFECNHLCGCGTKCKNKLVQWRRQVPLEIFKTEDKGWGLRCPEDLRKGEFIDCYFGEVITADEAEEREKAREEKGLSYLFSLDKFAEDNKIPNEDILLIDGERKGGPARFMNHSCDPNCRQFSVSYNHHDAYVYDLAFFALCDIPAFTELTFNYRDSEAPPDLSIFSEVELAKMLKCRCGEENCRGYLWE